jgi:hypothetical protein
MTHAGHDPLRVAEAVDRGARRGPVLDLCARCVRMYADLVALTAALTMSAVPARPRSFTLTADDARRLRPHGWRGWWSAVGSARDTVTRPLAIGLTTLGLAGLLLTAAPTLLVGLGGMASSGAAMPSEVAMVAASPQPGGRAPGVVGGATNDALASESDTGPSPTVTLSVGLVVIGGGLFVARRLAVHGRPMR